MVAGTSGCGKFDGSVDGIWEDDVVLDVTRPVNFLFGRCPVCGTPVRGEVCANVIAGDFVDCGIAAVVLDRLTPMVLLVIFDNSDSVVGNFFVVSYGSVRVITFRSEVIEPGCVVIDIVGSCFDFC